MKTIGYYITATRPKTLIAAAMPIAMASFFASRQGPFDYWILIVITVVAFFIQIATNVANDYYDAKQGGDTANRIGPTRVTAAGLIPANHVKRIFMGLFLMAFILGLLLVAHGGWVILVIGLLSIFFGYAYTGGPYPLAYHGLGDVFAGLFFGPIAFATTFYLLTLHFAWTIAAIGLIPAGVAVGLLTINNLRDFQEDSTTGKRTLIVRWGRGFGYIELVLANIVTGGGVFWMLFICHSQIPIIIALVPLLTGLGIVGLCMKWPVTLYNRLLAIESSWGLLVAIFFCGLCWY